VTYGSRNPRADGPGGEAVVAVGDAIEGADVVVFAIPAAAVEEVAAEHGAALAGKVVLDATNRMGAAVVNNRAEIAAHAPDAKYVRAFNTLGWENFAAPLADVDLFFAADPEARATAETLITNRMGASVVNNRAEILAAAPDAKYVRAFNTLGWENFADPLPDADLFFAADPEARAIAETLIKAVGLRPQYLGDADAAATVDALLPVWFALTKQRGGNRKVALRVVE